VGAALTAQTHGELAALVSDLPAAAAWPAGAPTATPKELVRIDCHASTAGRDGRWLVPRRMEVQVTSGSVTLDFTEAVTSWPLLQLEVAVRGGSLLLVTRPGILVSTDDLAVRASSVKVRAPRPERRGLHPEDPGHCAGRTVGLIHEGCRGPCAG
jgi:hypothetical protein